MSNGKKDDKSFDPNDFDFGGGDDTSSSNEPFDFSFEDMPAPGGQAPAKNEFAKPVDDGGFGDDSDFGAAGDTTGSGFGDLDVDDGFGPSSGFDAPVNDGFSSSSDGFAPAGEDAFAGDSFAEEPFHEDVAASDEPVADFEEAPEEVFEETSEGSSDERSFLQKNIFNLAVAGLGVFVLAFGWVYFSPMLLPPAEPVQQSLAIPNDVGTSMPAAPVPSSTPAFTQDVGVPVLPGDVASAPAPSLPAPTLPSPEPAAAPQLPAPSMDIGGNDPAPAMQAAPVAAVDAEEVDELRSLVADLADQVESLKTQVATLEARPTAPATPEPAVGAPDKPPVLDGWVLKGVQNGVAWVEGPNGFVEVEEGSTLPGAGQVQNITLYEGDWMIVTEQGVILQN